MTSILLPLLLTFIAVLVVSLVAAWARRPAVLGGIGEYKVHRTLRKALDAREYRIYSDVILPSLDGTTQIDHVVISCFGVFVIETKNLRGLVVGNPRSAQWTQRIGRRSFPFQSPLRQNYRHVKAIESALDIDVRDITPIVVFAGDCLLNPAIAEYVTPINSLASTILRNERLAFSLSQRDELCARLDAVRIDSQPDAKRSHLRGLRERHRRPDNHR